MGDVNNDRKDPSGAAERDSRFRSGRWRGFWIQGQARSRTELDLRFAEGEVGGQGHDWVGDYVITGFYDTESGKVSWVKSYVGSHVVEYDGCAETTNGIWGLWSIGGYDKGGFQIWPEDQEGELPARSASAARPVDRPVSWGPVKSEQFEQTGLRGGI